MSLSSDEKFRWQCSTIAVGSPWGGTNEVLFDLADPRVVQPVLEGGFQGVQMSPYGDVNCVDHEQPLHLAALWAVQMNL